MSNGSGYCCDDCEDEGHDFGLCPLCGKPRTDDVGKVCEACRKKYGYSLE